MLKSANIKTPTVIDVLLPRVGYKVSARTRDIVSILSFTLLTAIGSNLKMEIGPVPITMQNFAVLLSGAFLGSKKGALSQIFYLFGGLAGIPWFAKGGGIAYVLNPSFGYIIGFVLAAFFVG